MALAAASSGGLMLEPTAQRNRRLRFLRSQRWSTWRLARHFAISQVRVRQILRDTGGDPLRAEYPDLAIAPIVDLERERERLRDRIRADRRRLRVVEEELQSRMVDRIAGLYG
ncbi:MAG TPA: hypothetical protein VFR93_02245 [Candidatus Limnocylindrales bacterium]|nr:hypothetical protein [Candidatus Limnocylindrales bacterium]